ncbi:MAG: riboflavin biosynthesis protein RibF [Acidobacteria bacterium]|nr:riboflavin biosynthesis protein RibF [Acidobacteriota bacterium]
MVVRRLSHLSFSRPTAVTLGTFDGLHRGHQALFDKVKSLAKERELRSVVLTFSQPPQNHINGKPKKKLILPLKKKLELLASSGIDEVVVVGFQEIGTLSPLEFAQRILKEQLKVADVVVGYDCRFGRDRAGDGETLKTLGDAFGFRVTVIEPVMVDGVVVSSTEVRRAIQAGDVERAVRLLGYTPFLCGRVVQGHGSGRRLGSSGGNLVVSENLVTPEEGLFLVRASLSERDEVGILSIKHRPGLQDNSKFLEVRLLNARVDRLNGAEMELTLLKRLREEEDHIERMRRLANYNRSRAARAVDMPLWTLRSKMKKLGVER